MIAVDLSARIQEIWRTVEDEGRIDSMDEYFTEDYVRRSDEGEVSRDGFRTILIALHEGFPDMTFAIVDTVEEGDRVAYRWESIGTHDGPYLGVPPTRKRVVARGITISRFDETGRIAEDWASWNKVSVLHTLGIVPIS